MLKLLNRHTIVSKDLIIFSFIFFVFLQRNFHATFLLMDTKKSLYILHFYNYAHINAF